MDENSTKALLALGANLPGRAGSPRATVEAALDRLSADFPGRVRVSRLYETPAFPPGSGPPFVNGCAAIVWDGAPDLLLARLHEIEAAFGRARSGRWEPRVLDLDLIALGASVCPGPATQDAWRGLPSDRQRVLRPDTLVLPHPRLQDRAFVLVPLMDIAPGWRHPRTGRSVREMVASLPPADREAVRPIE